MNLKVIEKIVTKNFYNLLNTVFPCSHVRKKKKIFIYINKRDKLNSL